MQSRQNHLTTWVVNIITISTAAVFIGRVLWQISVPNASDIAKKITVRIDGANTGSGVIVEHQGDRYVVLSNWHVVNVEDPALATKSFTIRTGDGHLHFVTTRKISRVGKLDLAILEFQSRNRYSVASIGNSDTLNEGEILYVSGWADPSPELSTRVYQFLVGNLSGRIAETVPPFLRNAARRGHQPQDGYALVYTVNALPGMSGGPVLDSRGNLVGINGRATVDLRTGTVTSVLGIDINRYLRTIGKLPSQKWRKYN
jgi:S1-C subfamily serine protease